MSHFDELPSLKRKKPAPARDAPTPPVPSKPPFEFKSPEDTPEGVRYQATADGFVVSAPSRSWILAIGLFAFAGFLGYLLSTYGSRLDTPASFRIAMVVGMTALSFAALKFILGRTRVRLHGDALSFGDTMFGIGFSRSVSIKRLEKARVIKRAGVRGFITPGVGSATTTATGVGMSRVTDAICEIETNDAIYSFGKHLQFKHLHYMRYLIVTAAKERRLPKAAANPSLPQA